MNAEELARIAEERLALEEEVAWLQRLENNKDFQRFLGIWKNGVKVLKERLRDEITLPPEQRLALTDRYLSLEQVPDWASERLAALKDILKEQERLLTESAK